MNSTAAFALQKAIEAVLLADAQVLALIGNHGIHNLIAPRDAEPPYIIVGNVSENSANLFSQKGNAGVQTLKAVGGTPDQAWTLYEHAKRLLGRIPVEENQVLVGDTDVLRWFIDPDNPNYIVVFEYRTRTVMANG